jgi:tRNA(Arg) A34 adenosine deaminase TadA
MARVASGDRDGEGGGDDARFMRAAIRLSLQSVRTARGGPFGAVVVRDGAIVGRGWNRVTASSDPTAHAEIVAIRSSCRRLRTFTLEGATLYTSCEPCPMCLGAAYWAGIARIYFAADRRDAAAVGFIDDELYRELSLPPAGRRVPAHQLLREQAVATFAEWASRQDRIPY